MYDSIYRLKYWPRCNFQFCAYYLLDFSLLILQLLVMLSWFFTFSYVTPPAAIINLPSVTPQDCIKVSTILSWLKEIFSSVFTVKKRVCWIAHAIPDVTKSGAQIT